MRRMPDLNQLCLRYNATKINELPNQLCEDLECGDIVTKEDETGKHCYICSYKKAHVGLCLTYTDASCVETVSYDYTDGAWVYNSTDITPLGE